MAQRIVTPAVPPLSTIKDPDVRRALEALVNGWRTRNGETNPDSDDRFITKGELQGLTEQGVKVFFNTSAGAQAVQNALTGPGAVGALVDTVASSVMSSYLWRKLGEKVDMIDAPQIFSRIGRVETVVRSEVNARQTADEAIIDSVDALGVRVDTSEAGLLGEVKLRANSDNALASAVNTLWATVGNSLALVQSGTSIAVNNVGAVATKWDQVQSALRVDPGNPNSPLLGTAAVREEARTEANKITGTLSAEKTIKVDVNGYVAGIGIIANQDLTTGATSSAFGVRADQFFIGAPAGNQSMLNRPPGSKVPFAVLTSTDAAGNPPGVYMDMAMIRVAAVDELYIAGDAVTVPRAATQSSIVRFYGAGYGGASSDEWTSSPASAPVWKTIASIGINFGSKAVNSKALVGFTFQITAGSGGEWGVMYRIARSQSGLTYYFNGLQGVGNNQTTDETVSTVFFDENLNGSYTYTLQVAIFGSIGADVSTGIARSVTGGLVYVLGAKR